MFPPMQTPRTLLGIVSATVLSFAAAHHTLADLIIKQEIEQAGAEQKTEITMSVKGMAARMDSGELGSAVIDGAKGTITRIMHPLSLIHISEPTRPY